MFVNFRTMLINGITSNLLTRTRRFTSLYDKMVVLNNLQRQSGLATYRRHTYMTYTCLAMDVELCLHKSARPRQHFANTTITLRGIGTILLYQYSLMFANLTSKQGGLKDGPIFRFLHHQRLTQRSGTMRTKFIGSNGELLTAKNYRFGRPFIFIVGILTGHLYNVKVTRGFHCILASGPQLTIFLSNTCLLFVVLRYGSIIFRISTPFK